MNHLLLTNTVKTTTKTKEGKPQTLTGGFLNHQQFLLVNM